MTGTFWLISFCFFFCLKQLYQDLTIPITSYSNQPFPVDFQLPLSCTYMGLFASILRNLWGEREVRILILGLDNAGKTTILYKMQVGEVVSTVPTIGFNMETINFKNVKLQVWDLGGQDRIRPYWRCYYTNTDAIVYVVDSTDRDRMGVAKEELFAMLEEEELDGAALAVFANKQDKDGAASMEEISDKLGLTNIRSRQWSIFKTSALKGQGLEEGMEWVVQAIDQQR